MANVMNGGLKSVKNVKELLALENRNLRLAQLRAWRPAASSWEGSSSTGEHPQEKIPVDQLIAKAKRRHNERPQNPAWGGMAAGCAGEEEETLQTNLRWTANPS
jgi:hypothetical protein